MGYVELTVSAAPVHHSVIKAVKRQIEMYLPE